MFDRVLLGIALWLTMGAIVFVLMAVQLSRSMTRKGIYESMTEAFGDLRAVMRSNPNYLPMIVMGWPFVLVDVAQDFFKK